MPPVTKADKTEAPKTYGKEQGYKDRRIPMRTPGDTIRTIWGGIMAPRKKPIRRKSTGT